MMDTARGRRPQDLPRAASVPAARRAAWPSACEASRQKSSGGLKYPETIKSIRMKGGKVGATGQRDMRTQALVAGRAEPPETCDVGGQPGQTAHSCRFAKTPAGVLLGLLVLVSLEPTVTWLLNGSLYPAYDQIFSWARDINQITTACSMAVVLLAAMRRPAALVGPCAFALSGAAVLMGIGLAFAGVQLASPAFITLGTCMRGAGDALLSCYVGLSLIRCAQRQILAVLLGGYLLSYPWMLLLSSIGLAKSVPALMLVSTLQLLLLGCLGRPVRRSVAAAGSPADLQITNPLSFLPFTSRLFTAIFLVMCAYGFEITSGSVDSQPQPVYLALLPLLLVAGYACLRRRLGPDMLYGFSFTCILAGLLLWVLPALDGSFAASPVPDLLGAPANVLIKAGNDLFAVTVAFTLACVGKRNIAGALPVLLLRRVASGLGVGLGAALGLASNALVKDSPLAATLLVLGLTFVFTLYNFYLARSFSFDRMVEALLPVPGPLQARTHGQGQGQALGQGQEKAPALGQVTLETPGHGADLDSVCSQLAAKYSLTTRESEVFRLLARGRNVGFIQEALTLSRNTIKTHVANIYSKLDVHSHQDLIGMVEEALKAAAPGD